jgi:hypothetical protein
MAQHLLRHFLFLDLHVPASVRAFRGWRGIAPDPFTAKRPSLYWPGPFCSLCAARAWVQRVPDSDPPIAPSAANSSRYEV